MLSTLKRCKRFHTTIQDLNFNLVVVWTPNPNIIFSRASTLSEALKISRKPDKKKEMMQ